MKYLLITSICLLSLLVVSKAYAGPYTRYELDIVEQALKSGGYYTAWTGDGLPIPPRARFDRLIPKRASTNISRPLSTLAAGKLTKKMLATRAAQAIPYVGLGITAYMLIDDVKDIVTDDPEGYPTLDSLMHVRPFVDGTQSVASYNDLIKYQVDKSNTGKYWLTNGWYKCGGGFWGPSPPPASRSQIEENNWPMLTTRINVGLRYNGPTQMYYEDYYCAQRIQEVQEPPKQLATNQEIEDNYEAANNMTDEPTALQNDEAKLFDEHPDKVHQPDAAEVGQAIADDITDEIIENKRQQIQSLQNAKSIYDQSCSQGNTADCAKAEEIQREIDRLNGEILKEDNDRPIVTIMPPPQEEPEEDMPPNDSAELQTINFDKFTDLKNVLSNKWPFSLLLSVADTFSQLIAEPVAPSFDLHIYQGNVAHVSLDIFDSVAALLRWIWRFLMVGGCIWSLVYWWRGAT